MWPAFFSRKRRTSVSNNSSTTINSLLKDFRNKDHEDIQAYTIKAKSEEKALNLKQGNEHSLIEQETNLHEDSLPRRKIETVSREKAIGEVRQKAEREGIPSEPVQKVKKSLTKVQKEAERVIHEEADQKTQQVVLETPRLVKLDKEETLNVPQLAEELPTHEAMIHVQGKTRRVAGQAESIRKLKEAIAQTKMETKRLNREETTQAVGEPGKKVLKDAEVVRNTNQASTQDKRGQALALIELQTNLKIATTPWDSTPLPFQTEIWDRNIGQFDTMGEERRRNLGEAYLDMHMANQIVWLFTSLGSISNDLAASYRLLCAKVAERLTLLLQ
jgi:hypothetical protein